MTMYLFQNKFPGYVESIPKKKIHLNNEIISHMLRLYPCHCKYFFNVCMFSGLSGNVQNISWNYSIYVTSPLTGTECPRAKKKPYTFISVSVDSWQSLNAFHLQLRHELNPSIPTLRTKIRGHHRDERADRLAVILFPPTVHDTVHPQTPGPLGSIKGEKGGSTARHQPHGLLLWYSINFIWTAFHNLSCTTRISPKIVREKS